MRAARIGPPFDRLARPCLSGGVGSVSGTLFGALIRGVMNNGLDILGVESFYQSIVKGVLIVGAVILDASRESAGN